MREILFRGKRLDNGEWVYWDAFGRFVTKGGKGSRMVIRTDSSVSTYYLISQRFDLLDKNTIGQFTGLTGKNGKRIFEGDIVRLYLFDSEEIGEIVWDEEQSKFAYWSPEGVAYGVDGTVEFEILGNIHDNPELLEG